MVSRAKIANMDRMRAIVLREQGHSMRQIAEQLKRSVSCVHRLISRFEETKSIQDRHRSTTTHHVTAQNRSKRCSSKKKSIQWFGRQTVRT